VPPHAPHRRSSQKQETINVLRRCLRSSYLLAAPASGAGADEVVHSALGLLYHHLDALYATGAVPDEGEFERFLAILVSEVADNTYAAGMEPYADKKLGSGGGVEERAPFVKSAQGGRGTVRFTLLNSGLRALERCAWQYLESGGGNLGKLPSKRRRALDGVLRDFDFFDPLREARGLPSASALGLGFLRDAQPRFCSLFQHPSAKTPQVTVAMDEVKAHFDRVVALARDVGAHLAKLQPSLPTQEGAGEGLAAAENLNCGDAKSPGLMQNLNEARRFLRPRTQRDGVLARFLDYAVELAQRRAHQVCVRLVGPAQAESRCDPRRPSASCQHRADVAPLPGVRRSELPGFRPPPPREHATAAVDSYMLPEALRSLPAPTTRPLPPSSSSSASPQSSSSSLSPSPGSSSSHSLSSLPSSSSSSSSSSPSSSSRSTSSSSPSPSSSSSSAAAAAHPPPTIPSGLPAAALPAPTALATEALRRGIPRHLLPL
jgi:hypothetical protein